MAMTAQPAEAARIISAIESEPPDTAQLTSVPGGGKVHSASSSAMPGTPSANECPHPVKPLLRIADLVDRWQVLRRAPAHVDDPRAALGFDGGAEALAR